MKITGHETVGILRTFLEVMIVVFIADVAFDFLFNQRPVFTRHSVIFDFALSLLITLLEYRKSRRPVDSN